MIPHFGIAGATAAYRGCVLSSWRGLRVAEMSLVVEGVFQQSLNHGRSMPQIAMYAPRLTTARKRSTINNAGEHRQMKKEQTMSQKAQMVEKLKAKGASDAVILAAKAKLGR